MATVYVSNTTTNGYAVGNDANTYAQAQSKSTPKLTIISALSVTNAGDSIVINSGEYVEASAVSPVDANLTISSDGGAVVVKNNTAGLRVCHIASTATGIVFNGITFDAFNQTRCITAQTSSVYVDNCTFINCSFINFANYGILNQPTGIKNLTVTGCIFSSAIADSFRTAILANQSGSGAIAINNCEITLSGCTGTTTAIQIYPSIDEVSVICRDNEISINGSIDYGINIKGCEGIEISHNRINLTSTSAGYGMQVYNHSTILCDRCTIFGNTIDCNGSGGGAIFLGDDTTPTAPNMINNAVIEFNTVLNSNHGIFSGHTTASIIRNNVVNNGAIGVVGKSSTNTLFANNKINGVTSLSGGLRSKGGTNDIFINNTVYVRGTDTDGIPCYVTANDAPVISATGIIFKNNIMFCAGGQSMVLVPSGNSATFADNTYFSPNGESTAMWSYDGTNYDNIAAWNASLEASGELFIDPLLIDAVNGDLRLHSTSPLVAAGLATVTREPLSSTLEDNTPGPLNVSATITAGTTYPDITIKAPLGPEFQEIAEWTGGAAVDLSTFAGSNYTRVGERGMMIYGSERTAAEIAAIDRYLGVV